MIYQFFSISTQNQTNLSETIVCSEDTLSKEEYAS